MDKINWQNGVTPLNKETMDNFQNNIEKASVIVSPTKPTSNERVWFKKGKNLLIPIGTTSAESAIVNNNDIFTFKENLPINWYNCMAKADLEAGIEYTISCSNDIGYGRIGLATMQESNPDDVQPDFNIESLHLLYKSKKSTTFISNKKQIVYLKYCTDTGRENLSSFTTLIQLEQGPKATSQEPYIEEEIYIKNDNGVYEKLAIERQKKQNVYSNDETIVGTWFDKPLYRKSLSFNTGNIFGSWIEFPHGIENVEKIWVKMCYIDEENNTTMLPDKWTQLRANSTNISYVIEHEGSGYGNKNGRFIVEYTKTTD